MAPMDAIWLVLVKTELLPATSWLPTLWECYWYWLPGFCYVHIYKTINRKITKQQRQDHLATKVSVALMHLSANQ